MYRNGVKRAFDLALAVPALILLSPLMGPLALLVRISMGTPVLFTQQRPGLHGRPFVLYKFRTMTDARDPQGALLSDTERLTRLGGLLRRTSLDELPQLINVVSGDMSLVGPRPLLIRYLPYFRAHEVARSEVRPGITGLAQVTGRNDMAWEARLAADARYARECSLVLDVRILFTTFARVVLQQGVQEDPGARMLSLDEERASELHASAVGLCRDD